MYRLYLAMKERPPDEITPEVISIASGRSELDVAAIVTGEGQKTSSVLSRALSRIEMRIQAETIRLSDRSWSKRKSYCP